MLFPRMVFLIAGIVAGALTKRRQPRDSAVPELQRSIETLAGDTNSLLAAHEGRLQQLEARIEDHETKLEEAPSSTQIISAMDDLFAKAMSGLDRRLTAQARSIETLQEASACE